jgi:hypothetical protein
MPAAAPLIEPTGQPLIAVLTRDIGFVFFSALIRA